MTATLEPEAVPELEMEAVKTGPSARAVLAAGGLCLLFVLYALFQALTGSLGTLTLLLLALGFGGLFFVYKQIDKAADGDLAALKQKMADRSKSSSIPAPSVRVQGDLLDI